MIIEILKSIIIGGCFGIVCGLFDLPIPAPGTIAGVCSIIGVCVGYWLTRRLL